MAVLQAACKKDRRRNERVDLNARLSNSRTHSRARLDWRGGRADAWIAYTRKPFITMSYLCIHVSIICIYIYNDAVITANLLRPFLLFRISSLSLDSLDSIRIVLSRGISSSRMYIRPVRSTFAIRSYLYLRSQQWHILLAVVRTLVRHSHPRFVGASICNSFPRATFLVAGPPGNDLAIMAATDHRRFFPIRFSERDRCPSI